MPLPITFLANDTARSADVNANFSYLSGVVGSSSSSSRLDLPGDILIGPRNNQQLSGNHDNDALNNTRKFFHIGMNLEYYNAGGGNWKYRRMVNNQIGMSYHFTHTGFEVWATAASSGSDPNPTMSERFGVYDKYMYLPEAYPVYATNGDPAVVSGGRGIQDHRTTLQMMNTPGMLFNGVSTTAQTTHKKATDYGVSTYAVAILVSGRIWTSDGGGARLKFYRDEATPNDVNGFEISTSGGGNLYAATGQGVVPLGTGSYNHRFIVYASANITYAKVGIIGYYL